MAFPTSLPSYVHHNIITKLCRPQHVYIFMHTLWIYYTFSLLITSCAVNWNKETLQCPVPLPPYCQYTRRFLQVQRLVIRPQQTLDGHVTSLVFIINNCPSLTLLWLTSYHSNTYPSTRKLKNDFHRNNFQFFISLSR